MAVERSARKEAKERKEELKKRQGLAIISRRVIGCHVTQDMRVQKLWGIVTWGAMCGRL